MWFSVSGKCAKIAVQVYWICSLQQEAHTETFDHSISFESGYRAHFYFLIVFRFNRSQILGLSDAYATNRTIPIEGDEYTVRDLSPGATYQVQAFTVFDNRESLAYTSHNFTTSKKSQRPIYLALSRFCVHIQFASERFGWNFVPCSRNIHYNER